MILVSVSLLAPRCQGLTYPQPHSRSRWLLCEGHSAQRLVAADPASPRPSLRHTRRHPGFPGPPSARHPSFFFLSLHGRPGRRGERSLLWASQTGHCSADNECHSVGTCLYFTWERLRQGDDSQSELRIILFFPTVPG